LRADQIELVIVEEEEEIDISLDDSDDANKM